MNELDCIDCNNIKEFSLNGMICDAKVVKVYDGDTITLIFKLFDNYYKWSCRLDGIDTPELKSKNTDEKNAAIKARDFLSEKILNKIVKVHCGNFDKYGRLLGTIFLNEMNINELMIEQGYGVGYDGGTKKKWC